MVTLESASAAFGEHYKLDPDEPILFRPLFMPAVIVCLYLYAFLNRNRRPAWLQRIYDTHPDRRR
jgi:hypothetical protein